MVEHFILHCTILSNIHFIIKQPNATEEITTQKTIQSTPKPGPNFWSKSRLEIAELLGKDGNWYHGDTIAPNYLPNVYDWHAGTCGQEAKIGYIVGGRDTKPGAYPFIAALGTDIVILTLFIIGGVSCITIFV